MILSIENLNVEYYRRGQVIRAVRDFSFSIEKGETVGLVGESGSGKSTVALAILRLIRPQEGRILSGRILFERQDLLALSEDRMRAIRGHHISMIFQDPFTSFNPVMSIRAQMEEISATGLEESLERVQLDPGRILAAYPHQLSGGQRQRVMIAMAMLTRPQLILADEPTTALDVLVQKDILDLLFTLQQTTGAAMLFISHNLAIVAQRTRRMVIMQEGQIVDQGSPRVLFQNSQNAYTRALIEAIPQLS